MALTEDDEAFIRRLFPYTTLYPETLPPPEELLRRTRILTALDMVVSYDFPDWYFFSASSRRKGRS